MYIGYSGLIMNFNPTSKILRAIDNFSGEMPISNHAEVQKSQYDDMQN